MVLFLYALTMNEESITLVNTRKDILVNNSIGEDIVLLPGAASGTPVSGSFAIPRYSGADSVDTFPVDIGQSCKGIVPILRQGQHL